MAQGWPTNTLLRLKLVPSVKQPWVCRDPPRPSTPTNQRVEIAPAVGPSSPTALQKADNQSRKIISVCENIHRRASGERKEQLFISPGYNPSSSERKIPENSN